MGPCFRQDDDVEKSVPVFAPRTTLFQPIAKTTTSKINTVIKTELFFMIDF